MCENEFTLVAAFKYMLEYDLSADVRRAVLSSIAATTRTVVVILERTRDVKDAVRRLAYKVIAEKIHVRALTIAQRVRLLRQGLSDRTGEPFFVMLNFYDSFVNRLSFCLCCILFDLCQCFHTVS